VDTIDAPVAPLSPRKYVVIVERASRANGVEGALVHALIFAESSYDPAAVSPAGASGLMQLMPETARRYGVADLFDPEQNVRAGVRHLKDLLEQFDGDVELAIAPTTRGPTRSSARVIACRHTSRRAATCRAFWSTTTA
jgi:soluble lytic murein transglycosylase-like protein